MRSRTLRSECITVLAATLVATLIATMFAFASAADATHDSHLGKRPTALVNSDNENIPTGSAREAVEAVDEGLSLRGPNPTRIPDPTPEPEAHNNEAPGTENTLQNEAPDTSAVTAPHEDTDQRDAQSAPTKDAPAPNTAQPMITPMSHQGPVSLTVTMPGPHDPNGYVLPSNSRTFTGDCGTVPSLGYRQITQGPTVIFTEVGSWSGPFTKTISKRGWGSNPNFELRCNYGSSGPPNTVTASAPPVSTSILVINVKYPNGVPATDLSILARDLNTGFERELRETQGGGGDYAATVFPGSYVIELFSADGDLLGLRFAVVEGYDEQVFVDANLPFPSPGTVSGTVTWADGSPLIDQQVFIAGTPTFEDPFPAEITRTDDHGVYEFPEIPSGEYTVQVLHDSHGFVASAPVTVEIGADHVVDMELDLSAPGAIQGYATFSDGTPVVSDGGGAGNVELVGPVHRFVHTGVDGAFTFDGVPHGTYELRVTGAYPLDIGDIDYTSDLIEVDVIPATTTSQDVVITMPTGSVKGGVFSDQDYVTPIPDVVVSIPALNVDADTTDADGRFHIDGVEGANKMFVIEVRTEDGVLLGSREWMLVTPGEHTSVPIYVTPPASLGIVDGTITWSNGTPVDDAEVRLVPESGGASLTAPVDSDGTYEFIGVTAGDYIAEVIVDGEILQDRTITVTSGGTTTEDFVLLLAGAIDGEARWADLSGPVAGVEVEITDGAVVLNDTSGPLGQFGFDDLAPGMWHVTATYDGDVIFTGPIGVPDGVTVGFLLDVPVPATDPDTGNVDGTVTWDDGTPVTGETVRLVPAGSGSNLETTTNTDGSYEFPSVEVGDYSVQVIIDGDVAAEQTATVDTDQTTTADLVIPVLVVTPDSGAIDGEARWADLSGPVEGVEVEVTDGAVVLNETTGPLGQFGFDDLAPGIWHLTATYDGDVVASHIVTVTEGDVAAVTIDVPVPAVTPDTGNIEGTVTWDDGTPVDGEAVLLVPVSGGTTLDTATNTDGTYEFSDVEVGDYLVQVIIDGDVAAEQTATVDTDQTTTVDLVVATANDSDTGSTPDDEAEEPKPFDSDGSDHGALPQTGLSSDTSALLFVAPLLLMLGLLTMWTARRNGVRRDLPK